MAVLRLLAYTCRALGAAAAESIEKARWASATARWAGRGAIALVLVTLGIGVLINHEAGPLLGETAPPESELSEEDLIAIEAKIAAAGGGDAFPTIAAGDSLSNGFDMPSGWVSLTFDDGPHPIWTPKILDELDRLDVKATFFVVGEQVDAYPHLAVDIVSRGHEIANHTYSHPQMGEIATRQIDLQLELTRLAVIDATGIDSRLYRPPYSGDASRLPPDEADAAARALDKGYVFVATNLAPPDFDPSITVDDIVSGAIPPVGSGGVITLHDGGGSDRSKTVAVLEPLVTQLRANDYRIGLVGEVVDSRLGLDSVRPASSSSTFQATTLSWLQSAASAVEFLAVWGSILFALLFVGRFAFLALVALRRRIKERNKPPLDDGYKPPVTVLVPAYNEAVGIAAAVQSIDATDWPDLEILVIDDGSTDGCADIAESLGLERVRVIRKPNGGKSTALNLGIREARHDIIVMVDGDTMVEPNTVPEIVKPLQDPNVGAVAGNPKIGNVTNFLARLQVSEYLMSSSLERRILAPAGMITTIPGAIGAWRRSALQEAGFVSVETLAEDTDLTVSIARGGWRIAYAGQARAWTEAPNTISSLFKQRTRWTFGTLQVLWKHRRALFDRGPGSQLGRVALPYMFVSGYLLAALAPLIDLVLLINVLLGNWRLAAAAWATIAVLATGAGIIATRLDGDEIKPALLVPVQQVAFRPLLHLVSLVAIRRAIFGQKQVWGVQQRSGGLSVRGAGDEPEQDLAPSAVAAA